MAESIRTSPPPPLPLQKPACRAALIASLVAGVFLVVRLFRLINRYSVDVPFFDHFGYYFILSEHPSLWTLFSYQHGPHRMGIGLVLSSILARSTRWNFRAEAFAVGAFLVAGCLTALLLKWRLFGKLAWYDIIIPLLLLTPAQWETWANVPMPSVDAIPMFLLMLYALALTIRSERVRPFVVVLIVFLGLFTGFALFLVPVTIGLLLLYLIRPIKSRNGKKTAAIVAALICILGMLALFFRDYHFRAGVSGFKFPDPNYRLYPYAMGLAMARACGLWGIAPATALFGGIMLLIAVIACCVHLSRATKPGNPRSLVIVAILSFSLLFVTNMAIGRISAGLEATAASHYVTLVSPCLVALYFAGLNLQTKWAKIIAMATLLMVAAFSGLVVKEYDRNSMQWYAHGKQLWVQTYLATGSIPLADQQAGLVLHPNPTRIHLQERLDFLRDHRLSFFRDLPRG